MCKICNFQDKNKTVCVYKFDCASYKWAFLGKHRAHYKDITSVFFLPTKNENGDYKLLSLGNDRVMVWFIRAHFFTQLNTVTECFCLIRMLVQQTMEVGRRWKVNITYHCERIFMPIFHKVINGMRSLRTRTDGPKPFHSKNWKDWIAISNDFQPRTRFCVTCIQWLSVTLLMSSVLDGGLPTLMRFPVRSHYSSTLGIQHPSVLRAIAVSASQYVISVTQVSLRIFSFLWLRRGTPSIVRCNVWAFL